MPLCQTQRRKASQDKILKAETNEGSEEGKRRFNLLLIQAKRLEKSILHGPGSRSQDEAQKQLFLVVTRCLEKAIAGKLKISDQSQITLLSVVIKMELESRQAQSQKHGSSSRLNSQDARDSLKTCFNMAKEGSLRISDIEGSIDAESQETEYQPGLRRKLNRGGGVRNFKGFQELKYTAEILTL